MKKAIKRFLEGIVLFLIAKKFVPEAKNKYNNKKRELEVNKRLDMIMELLEVKEKITNDDVQNVLGVADSTATKYLDELENQNLIIQNMETGRGVYYTKTAI